MVGASTVSEPSAGPREVANDETVAFIRLVIGDGHVRLLEVGCGDGEVAAALAALGHDVTGIDVDAGAVARAATRGVRAIEADLLRFEDAPFDAVLITHSLHHIAPLHEATTSIARLLRPGGWLLVEELDRAALDARATTWLDEQRAAFVQAGAMRVDARDARHAGHGHHHREHGHTDRLPGGSEMQLEIEKRFSVSVAERVPYLYRYLCDQLERTVRGADLARMALAQERDALARGAIDPAGLRIVARAP